MTRRLVLTLWVVLLASAACTARQLPNWVGGSAKQQPGTPAVDRTPVSAATFDLLVEQVAQQIIKKHLKSVVVIGVAGPMPDEPMQVGLELGDKFSVALAKHSKDFQVGERGELCEFVKKNGVSEVMVVSGAVANWIASRVVAEGYVLLEFMKVTNGGATLAATLNRTGKEDGELLGAAATNIDLTVDQYLNGIGTIDSSWNKLDYDAAENEKNPLPPPTMPTCLSCPKPEMTEQARKAGSGRDEGSPFKQTAVLYVTVLPDGTANKIAVIKSADYGLNNNAVDAITKWVFKPSVDADGKPTSFRVKVEIAWQLY